MTISQAIWALVFATNPKNNQFEPIIGHLKADH
jgi:hypothetical protein